MLLRAEAPERPLSNRPTVALETLEIRAWVMAVSRTVVRPRLSPPCLIRHTLLSADMLWPPLQMCTCSGDVLCAAGTRLCLYVWLFRCTLQVFVRIGRRFELPACTRCGEVRQASYCLPCGDGTLCRKWLLWLESHLPLHLRMLDLYAANHMEPLTSNVCARGCGCGRAECCRALLHPLDQNVGVRGVWCLCTRQEASPRGEFGIQCSAAHRSSMYMLMALFSSGLGGGGVGGS